MAQDWQNDLVPVDQAASTSPDWLSDDDLVPVDDQPDWEADLAPVEPEEPAEPAQAAAPEADPDTEMDWEQFAPKPSGKGPDESSEPRMPRTGTLGVGERVMEMNTAVRDKAREAVGEFGEYITGGDPDAAWLEKAWNFATFIPRETAAMAVNFGVGAKQVAGSSGAGLLERIEQGGMDMAHSMAMFDAHERRYGVPHPAAKRDEIARQVGAGGSVEADLLLENFLKKNAEVFSDPDYDPTAGVGPPDRAFERILERQAAEYSDLDLTQRGLKFSREMFEDWAQYQLPKDHWAHRDNVVQGAFMQGLGSMGTFMLAFGLGGPIGGIAAAGGMGAYDFQQDALENIGGRAAFFDEEMSELDKETVESATKVGVGMGFSQIAPIAVAFNRLKKPLEKLSGRKNFIRELGEGALIGVQEATLEGFYEYAKNVTANEFEYDPDRSHWENVKEAAGMGGAVGFTATIIMRAMLRGKGPKNPTIDGAEETATPDEAPSQDIQLIEGFESGAESDLLNPEGQQEAPVAEEPAKPLLQITREQPPEPAPEAQPEDFRPVVDDSADPATSTTFAETMRTEIDGMPAAFGMAFPGNLQIDPETYQYKQTDDPEGRTDRFTGEESWDPSSAGTIIIHRREDGDFVADGHQRAGLARARREAGENASNLFSQAIILNEADGWTPQDVRMVAALKNVREETGTAVDAAKLLREGGEAVVEALGDSINPRRAIWRDAEGLAGLADPIFQEVVNGVVPTDRGAIIGQYVTDPAKQRATLQYFQDNPPATQNEAQIIARDINRLEAQEQTQGGLDFGDAVANVPIKERAKILDAARKLMNTRKKVFKQLVKDQAMIEGEAGNVLDEKGNVKIAQDAENVMAVLNRMVDTSPELNEVLNNAAAQLANGETTASNAARELISRSEEVASAVLRGREDREGQRQPAGTQEPAQRQEQEAQGAVRAEGDESTQESLIPDATTERAETTEAAEPEAEATSEAAEGRPRRRTGSTYRLVDSLNRRQARTLAENRDSRLGAVLGELDQVTRAVENKMRRKGDNLEDYGDGGRQYDNDGNVLGWSQEAVYIRTSETLAADMLDIYRETGGDVTFPVRDPETGDGFVYPEGDPLTEWSDLAIQTLEHIDNALEQGFPIDTIDEPVDYDRGSNTERMEPEDVFPAPEGETVNIDTEVKGQFIPENMAESRVESWKDAAAGIGENVDNSNKVIISLFDYTGAWSQPWQDAGYQVLRYDIKTNQDVLIDDWLWNRVEELRDSGMEIYGVLSACPCTTFAGSGARWWKERHDVSSQEMLEKTFGSWGVASGAESAVEYNRMLVQATRDMVEMANPTGFHVLENPIGRIAEETSLPDPTARFQPHNFGDPYTKRTQLWGAFNTEMPTANVKPAEGSKMQSKLRGDDAVGKEERSRTPEGFAYSFFMANDPTARAEAGAPTEAEQGGLLPDQPSQTQQELEARRRETDERLSGRATDMLEGEGELFAGDRPEQGDVFDEARTTMEPLPEKIPVDGRKRPTTDSEGRQIHPTQEGVEQFWRWFGKSKTVDSEGRPIVFYHGTTSDFSEFQSSNLTGGLMFFTPEADVGTMYAQGHRTGYPNLRREEDKANLRIMAESREHREKFDGIYLKANVDADSIVEALGDSNLYWAENIGTQLENLEISRSEAVEKYNENARQLWAGGNVMPVYIKAEQPYGSKKNPMHWREAEEFGAEFIASRGLDGVYVREEDGWGIAVVDNSQIKSAIGNTGAFSPEASDILEVRTDQDRGWVEFFGQVHSDYAGEVNPGREPIPAVQTKLEGEKPEVSLALRIEKIDWISPRSQEADVMSAAISDLVDAGFPIEVVESLDGFMYWQSASTNGRAGFYSPFSAGIGANDQIMAYLAENPGDVEAHQVFRLMMAHELGHRIDRGANGDSLAETSPLFGIEISQDGSRIELGDVAHEMYVAYLRGTEGLGEMLRYPFQAFDQARRTGKAGPDRIDWTKREIFAQIAGLYYTRPDSLRQAAPRAWEMMEEINNAYRDAAKTFRGARAFRQAIPAVRGALRVPEAGASSQDAIERSDRRDDREGAGRRRSARRVARGERGRDDGDAGPVDEIRPEDSDGRSRQERREDLEDLYEAMERAGLARSRRPIREWISDLQEVTWKEVRDRWIETDDSLIQGSLDRFHGIKRAEERRFGSLLPAEQSPYVAARLSTGVASIMRATLLHGAPVWRDGIIQQAEDSQGLLKILEPIKSDLNTFLGWMVGRRARRLATEGRENLFEGRHIEALIRAGENSPVFDQFQEVADNLEAFKHRILDVAEEAGLIDPEARAVWDHAEYIPFYRVSPENEGRPGPGSRDSLSGQSSGIRNLRGSERRLNDPLENMLMNFTHLIDAAVKNSAIVKVKNTLGSEGILEKVGMVMKSELIPMSQVKTILEEQGIDPTILPKETLNGIRKMWAITPPSEHDVVRIMEGGRAGYYRVLDPLLLRALTAVRDPGLNHPIVTVLRSFKRILTRGVTADPAFMLRNGIRDALHAWTISEDGFKLGVDSIRGVTKTLTETGGSRDMMFAGGSFLGGYVNATDPKQTSRAIRIALRERGYSASARDRFLGTVIDTPLRFWEMYTHIGDAVENASREAVYEAAMKAGKSKATAVFEAKDLMDYSMHGDWAIIQFLISTIPFLNARGQGNYKLGRAGFNAPVRIAARGSLISLAALALLALNKDDERYEALPDWDKDTYWHIFFPKELVGEDFWHIRIPKPFEIGVLFGTIPERIALNAMEKDDTEKTFERFMWSIRHTLAFDPVPQAFGPMLEVFANRNRFLDRQIENMADEGRLPEARYDERTSATMRALGRITGPTVGLSPKQLEHLWRGYTGQMGMYVLDVADVASRAAMDLPPRPKMRIDDYPVIRSFLRAEPARSSKYVGELYDLHREVSQLYTTIRHYELTGDEEKALRLAEEHADKLDARKDINDVVDENSKIHKEMELIVRSEDMTPDEKREEIDELIALRNENSRSGMKMITEFFKSLEEE